MIGKEELGELNRTLTAEEIAEDGKNMDMILDFKNDNSFRYAEVFFGMDFKCKQDKFWVLRKTKHN